MNKLNVFVSKKGWNDEEKAIALDKRGFVIAFVNSLRTYFVLVLTNEYQQHMFNEEISNQDTPIFQGSELRNI